MNKSRIVIIAVLLLLLFYCHTSYYRIEPEYMDYTTEAYNQRAE